MKTKFILYSLIISLSSVLSSCKEEANNIDPIDKLLEEKITSITYTGYNTITLLESNEVIEYQCITSIGLDKAYYKSYDNKDNFVNYEYFYSKDDNGHVNEDYLTINNEVDHKLVYDYNDELVLYKDSFLVSPFITYINNKLDFKKDGNNSYEYVGKYKNDLVYHITYDDLDVNKIIFNFKDNTLDTIQIVSNEYEINSVKVMSEYYLKVSDINKNNVRVITKLDNKYPELEDFFNNIKTNNNYTVEVIDSMYNGEIILKSLYKYNKDSYYSEEIDFDDDNNEIIIKSFYKYNNDNTMSYYDIDSSNNVKEVKRFYKGIKIDEPKFNFSCAIFTKIDNKYYLPYGISNDFTKEVISDYKGQNAIDGSVYLLFNKDNNLELHLEYSLLGLLNGELTYIFKDLNNTIMNVDTENATKYTPLEGFYEYNNCYKDEFNKVLIDVNFLPYLDGITYDYTLNIKTGLITIFTDLISDIDVVNNILNDYRNLFINKGYKLTFLDNENKIYTYINESNHYKVNLSIVYEEMSKKYSLFYEVKNTQYVFTDFNSWKDYDEEIDKALINLLGKDYNLPFFKNTLDISLDPSSIDEKSLSIFIKFDEDATETIVKENINNYINDLIKANYTKIDENNYKFNNINVNLNLVDYYGYYCILTVSIA